MQANIKFIGTAREYVPIYFKNYILRVLTLNFYYPFAKARRLKYLYENTELFGHPFQFGGNGRQLIKGYLLTVAVIIFFLFLYVKSLMDGNSESKFSIEDFSLYTKMVLVFLLPIYPWVVHSSFRYRMATTLYRGIRLGYQGKLWQVYLLYLKGILVALLTFGVGFIALDYRVRSYILANTKIGQYSLVFQGSRWEVALILVKFFAFILLFFYIPFKIIGQWAYLSFIPIYTYNLREVAIYRSKVAMIIDNKPYSMQSNLTLKESFFINILAPVGMFLSLGLATPWLEIWQKQVYLQSFVVNEDIPFDTMVQVNPDTVSSIGEGISENIGIDFGL